MKKLIEKAIRNVRDEYKARILINPEEADILESDLIPKDMTTNVYKSPLGIYIELVGKAEAVIETEKKIYETLGMDLPENNNKAVAKT